MPTSTRPHPYRRTGWHRRFDPALLVLPILLAACSGGTRPLGEDEQITRSVLELLASKGNRICLDDQTRENALWTYREMMQAPRASREQLRWYPPLPLWPGTQVQAGAFRKAELGSADLKIAEPEPRTDALDGLQQMALDSAARSLASQKIDMESVAIRAAWAPRGVTTRWWPLNRIRKDCKPLFELSNPVRGRDIAFVTVRAEHWGTLYALRKQDGKWVPQAEWSRWLY